MLFIFRVKVEATWKKSPWKRLITHVNEEGSLIIEDRECGSLMLN
jgi:hypothetical protein